MNTVGDLVRGREVYSVESSQTVFEAVQYMVEKSIGAVAVMEGERMVGIFSERDLMKRVVMKKLDPAALKLAQVMTTNLVIAAPGESYTACLAKMQSHGIRHLAVVERERLVGIISLRDLMSKDIKEKSAEIELMNAYLYYTPPAEN
ncbi:CBS domain-containing protein [candidate division KSB1 bacterium]|nr:CBS domain-containing protein [candidate division KSB1 bacterium]